MTYSPDLGRDFWYAFDLATQGSESFFEVIERAGAFDIQTAYLKSRSAGTYPASFVAGVQALRADWSTIAEVQTSNFDQFFANNWDDTQLAFEDFGQGVLLDMRPDRVGDRIHMMDSGRRPPIGYHRWHASIRAIQLLKIGDDSWWERLNTMVGLAWAIQSLQKPRQQKVPNPPINPTDLQAIRNAWLPMTPQMRDAQFDLPKGQDFGYHPSPMDPPAMAVV